MHSIQRFMSIKRCSQVLGLAMGAMYVLAFSSTPRAAELLAQAQIAAAPPALLRLKVSGTCTDEGAVFKLVNRSVKWPRTAQLRLYYADDKSLIGQRRLRLADNQRVSFAVKHKIAAGRPIGVWVDPGWYRRDFKFDAQMTCN